MTKRAIISLSILLFLITLAGVLFGSVFCLRKQSVTIIGNEPIEISKNEIIETAGFKKGKSIFMLDKNTAINNIEKKFPYVKVIQIQTNSVISINIQVRARYEMFYTKFNDNYYVLDEDLKVLKVVDQEGFDETTQLIHIEDDSLNIGSSTKLCDFVGSKYQQTTIKNLYSAMMTNVVIQDQENSTYLTRENVKEIIKEIKFEDFKTFNKVILTTKYGVKLDIENLNKNAGNKINTCFSLINHFISEANNNEKSGTIQIYHDLNGEQVCVYIPESQTNE